MKAMRRLGAVLWLALALVVGQQAAALHALAHASEAVAHKQDSKPAKVCGECCVAAQLSAGAPPASLPAVPLVDCTAAALAYAEASGRSVTTTPYHSRAPPSAS